MPLCYGKISYRPLIKSYFYEPIRKTLEDQLERKVELAIEKDKVVGGPIHASMFGDALKADVYIADLTGNNANVYLELGVRWTSRDAITIVVSQNIKEILFNATGSRAIQYSKDPPSLLKSIAEVVKAIREEMEDPAHCDSPVRLSNEFMVLAHDDIEQPHSEYLKPKIQHEQQWRKRLLWLSAGAVVITISWGVYDNLEAQKESLNRTQMVLNVAKKKLTYLNAIENENNRLKKQIANFAEKNTEALRERKALESRNVILSARNDTPSKPRPANNQPEILESKTMRPNKLVPFLAGAVTVTVRAKYISRTGASLMTNMDNESKFIEVGQLLEFRVGDKKYAFRVDETNCFFETLTTHEDNTIILSLLSMGDS